MNKKPSRWVFRSSLCVALTSMGTWMPTNQARADQVIADDLIIQGSVCIGLDAVLNESFGSDTIRLKENNLRIKFDDTSSSAGFAANDWQITINDENSGGANKFSIEDITGSKIPFTLIAGAPTNSLFVDSSGRMGLRTGNPLLDIHLATGNTPALRFEQISDSGFSAQTWDIGGNEANFFVRDLTGGSRLPFRIRPGAPTSSIDISANGNIGFGLTSPVAGVHFRKVAEAGAENIARFEVSDDAIGKLVIKNGSATNAILHPRIEGSTAAQAVSLTLAGLITDDLGTNPIVAFDGAKLAGGAIVNRPLVAFRNNLAVVARIAPNGDMFATSFSPTSSRALKDKIVDLDSSKASQALRNLTPVEYVYKNDPTGEGRVGFIAEDVPEIVANADRQSVPIMDVLALVTRVVKDQQSTIDNQRKLSDEQQQAIVEQKKTIDQQARFLDEQRKLNEDLMSRLARIEGQLQEKQQGTR